ncbi:AAA family ATPase [Sinorhizobium fredii]|uniref:AAA family ATPase n=1 Tax=Rhizobium fredii TaxID=380 RepID=UPI0004ADBB6F|nr:AAA family ATPase [Sinorhizobium fredii]
MKTSNSQGKSFNEKIQGSTIVYTYDDKTGCSQAIRVAADGFYETLDTWRELPSNDNRPKPDSSDDFEIETSAQLRKTWKPAEFVIDGVFQRRYLCTMTAPSGCGKTAIGQTVAAHIGRGFPLCGHDVEQGRVLYLAGENDTDITQRWLALSYEMGFDIDTIPVDFIRKRFTLTDKALDRIIRKANKNGPYAAVIVDTDTAYDPSADDNSNTQRKAYAMQLRRLLTINGEPCVIVLSHPAGAGGKLPPPPYAPRGGSAFQNEIDGNTYLVLNEGGIVTLNQHRKFRGPEFKPLSFHLKRYHSQQLPDSKGRPTSSVMAVPLSPDEAYRAKGNGELDEAIMQLLFDTPGLSLGKLAHSINKVGVTPSTVRNRLEKYLSPALVEKVEGKWQLTEKGKETVQSVRSAQACSGQSNSNDETENL